MALRANVGCMVSHVHPTLAPWPALCLFTLPINAPIQQGAKGSFRHTDVSPHAPSHAHRDELVIYTGSIVGGLLVDGLGDGVLIDAPYEDLEFVVSTSFGLLQVRLGGGALH